MRERLVGVHDQGRDGPTLLCQGGIHGNEPAGILAQERVLRRLAEGDLPFHGRFVAVAGNLAALHEGRRFLDRDLNRAWDAPRLAALRGGADAGPLSEDREQAELLALFAAVEREGRGPLLFVDLHTSSAEGSPFTCLGDTIPNRRMALALPVPTILGLEECIDGAVLENFAGRGIAGIAVEGGQHDDPATVERLEAALWILLVAAGCLDAGAVDLARYRGLLAEAVSHLPPVLEIRERHAIKPTDGFVMQPGFRSFQRVTRGTLLACDRNGEVRASEDGYLLLPLYQGQGEDGFFLARPVRPFWLHLSRVLRPLGRPAVLALLPGVRRHAEDPWTLLWSGRWASVWTIRCMHLLGYRRLRKREGRLQFSRRWARPDAWRLRPR
ncbi:MAG: succinylglutamate desuccinylase/aspartoacylase family protein [Planctomycetota bacterium]